MFIATNGSTRSLELLRSVQTVDFGVDRFSCDQSDGGEGMTAVRDQTGHCGFTT